jgi:hypothetical protein
MKIIDFKSISPFYEMERDGIKPFTIRQYDKDKRFKALVQWRTRYDWAIRITNPATGESFIRQLVNSSYLYYFNHSEKSVFNHTGLYSWLILILGKEITNNLKK